MILNDLKTMKNRYKNSQEQKLKKY